MTVHPLILPSSVLSKSLHNLPSAIPCVLRFLQMKGGWKGGDGMPIHYRFPHQQNVSTANERKKERPHWYRSFVIKRLQPFLNKALKDKKTYFYLSPLFFSWLFKLFQIHLRLPTMLLKTLLKFKLAAKYLEQSLNQDYHQYLERRKQENVETI